MFTSGADPSLAGNVQLVDLQLLTVLEYHFSDTGVILVTTTSVTGTLMKRKSTEGFSTGVKGGPMPNR